MAWRGYQISGSLFSTSAWERLTLTQRRGVSTQVRDNSYVLFLIGIFIDHAYFCFAYLEDYKTCHKLTGVASDWVIDVAMVRPPPQTPRRRKVQMLTVDGAGWAC
jgi:hypothetical protein